MNSRRMFMHISDLELSRGTSCLLKLYLPRATEVQFPVSLSETCQGGIILYSAELACTIFHFFLTFIEKSHTKKSSSDYLGQWGQTRWHKDRQQCSCILLKEASSISFFFFLYFLFVMPGADIQTNVHSVNAYINRFSSKYTFENIKLLKLGLHRVNHFNKLKSCSLTQNPTTGHIHTTFKRYTTDMIKWYQLQLIAAEEWEVCWFWQMWQAYVLTNMKTLQWQSFSTVVRGGWAHFLSLFTA